jgi:hypothetical protein
MCIRWISHSDVLSPLLFNFTPEYAIKPHPQAEDIETKRDKVYADVNLLGEHTNMNMKQKL